MVLGLFHKGVHVTFYQGVWAIKPMHVTYLSRRLANVSINYFPDYKHLFQENYMEYKYIFYH